MPQTRTLLRRVLESRGHVVYTAEDAASAYAVVRSHGESISLVLMDVNLGRTWGDRVAQVLRQRMPNSRYVFMTALDAAALVRDGHLDPRAVVLHKPFTLAQVTEVVQTALG